MRLIDADELKKEFATIPVMYQSQDIHELIDNAPTIDAVPIVDKELIDELKLLARYLSAPVVYLDGKSGYFRIKSGGTKQEVYKRFFNAHFFLRGLINRLEGKE